MKEQTQTTLTRDEEHESADTFAHLLARVAAREAAAGRNGGDETDEDDA